LLKIAVSELVIIKLIHKFVDFQIASSNQSIVEENVLLNLSESGKEVLTCFSWSKVCSHICMFKI